MRLEYISRLRSAEDLEALRRSILAADADDVEGAVPVCEDSRGRAVALVSTCLALCTFARVDGSMRYYSPSMRMSLTTAPCLCTV